MGYEDYIDVFNKCQETAKHRLFVYDLENSRKIENRKQAQSDIIQLLFAVYNEIAALEEVTGKNILYKSDDLHYGRLRNEDGIYKIEYPNEPFLRADLCEPFLITGDLMGFTIERGTLNSAQVDYIFEKCKSDLELDYSFHKSNGYYETDKWEEGCDKCFRGYCIQQLEKDSKLNERKQKQKEERER